MFKLEKEPKFWASVTVVTPSDNGGVEQAFKARFKVQPASEVEKVDNMFGGAPLVTFLKETVIDLAEVTDDAGETISFSEALLDQVLDHFGARQALWNTYIREVTSARVGNSSGSAEPSLPAS
ncbi:MAG: hypothetical protein AAGL96_15985 [Pseudomonadota bacterium]